MAELALRNHVIEGAEVIGTFTDDGVIISEERASGLPLSGPISLSAIGSYLGQGNKMWMSNGYLKDLAQSPSTKKSLSEYYGAAWGQPHQTVNQGAGMQIVKWDWRFDGDSNVTNNSASTSGGWGDTTATASIQNNSSMLNPAAYSGNGYFYAHEATSYRLSFKFSGRRAIGTPTGNGAYLTNIHCGVFGYTNGYINGPRADLVAYQPIATGATTSGSRSFNFSVPSGNRHVVVNFSWWCNGWQGAPEGIECSISNAKVVRTA